MVMLLVLSFNDVVLLYQLHAASAADEVMRLIVTSVKTVVNIDIYKHFKMFIYLYKFVNIST